MTGTYIYCRRYSEAKSVLICAVRCPYALGCRDWAGALAGDQRERIEQEVQAYVQAKGIVLNPEVWQPLSAKRKRRANLRRGMHRLPQGFPRLRTPRGYHLERAIQVFGARRGDIWGRRRA